MKTVALVARHKSIAATARDLDLDPSTVSRMVSNVETELGVRLFQRSTRSLQTTEEGARYLAQVAPLLDEFDHAQDVLRSQSDGPSGTLRMTTSVSFAQTCVMPYVKEFFDRFPAVSLELQTSDANVNLIAENIDLAIRLAPEPTGDLISSRLITTTYAVYASPDYVAQNPPIKAPQDLSEHACLCFALPGFRSRWQFRKPGTSPQSVVVNGRLFVSNALALRRAALDGNGPALLPDWLVREDVRRGKIVRLLEAYECTATEFDTAAWALYPSRSFLPQKVRVMIDFLREKLGQSGAP